MLKIWKLPFKHILAWHVLIDIRKISPLWYLMSVVFPKFCPDWWSFLQMWSWWWVHSRTLTPNHMCKLLQKGTNKNESTDSRTLSSLDMEGQAILLILLLISSPHPHAVSPPQCPSSYVPNAKFILLQMVQGSLGPWEQFKIFWMKHKKPGIKQEVWIDVTILSLIFCSTIMLNCYVIFLLWQVMS